MVVSSQKHPKNQLSLGSRMRGSRMAGEGISVSESIFSASNIQEYESIFLDSLKQFNVLMYARWS